MPTVLKKTPFFLLALIALLVTSGCKMAADSTNSTRRISDTPIIPGYAVNPRSVIVVRNPEQPTELTFSATPGSYRLTSGAGAALKIAVFSAPEEFVVGASQPDLPPSMDLSPLVAVGTLQSLPNGSVAPTQLSLSEDRGYLLLFVVGLASENPAVPGSLAVGDRTAVVAPTSEQGVGFFENLFPVESRGLWTTPKELQELERAGPGWTQIINRARAEWPEPDLSDPRSPTDTHTMAGALAYAAAPTQYPQFRRKVIDSISKLIAKGRPTGSIGTAVTNLPGFIIAADLVGFRTSAFDTFLINMTRRWTWNTGAWGTHTMRSLWLERGPYPVGLSAALALALTHAYLGEAGPFRRLVNEVRSLYSGKPLVSTWLWMNPQWQADPETPRLINPLGAKKDCSGTLVNISGALPPLMGTKSPCTGGVTEGGRMWLAIEALVSIARVAERQGLPFWTLSHKGLLRATQALEDQYRLPLRGFKAMSWIYRFLDKRYGTSLSCRLTDVPEHVQFGPGRSVGFAWVEKDARVNCPQ